MNLSQAQLRVCYSTAHKPSMSPCFPLNSDPSPHLTFKNPQEQCPTRLCGLSPMLCIHGSCPHMPNYDFASAFPPFERLSPSQRGGFLNPFKCPLHKPLSSQALVWFSSQMGLPFYFYIETFCLRYNSHTLLQGYNSVAFSTFTKLYNHHHCLISEQFLCP